MTNQKSGDPLHGITLETIVTKLYEHYGWERLGGKIKIKCFTDNPSIKSSLKFLRKTHGQEQKWRNFTSSHVSGNSLLVVSGK